MRNPLRSWSSPTRNRDHNGKPSTDAEQLQESLLSKGGIFFVYLSSYRPGALQSHLLFFFSFCACNRVSSFHQRNSWLSILLHRLLLLLNPGWSPPSVLRLLLGRLIQLFLVDPPPPHLPTPRNKTCALLDVTQHSRLPKLDRIICELLPWILALCPLILPIRRE